MTRNFSTEGIVGTKKGAELNCKTVNPALASRKQLWHASRDRDGHGRDSCSASFKLSLTDWSSALAGVLLLGALPSFGTFLD